MTHDTDNPNPALIDELELPDDERAELAEAMGLLEHLNVEPDAYLVDDTLFAIRQAITAEQTSNASVPRWRQWTSVAAASAIVLAMLTLIPAALNRLKTSHLRALCSTNLRTIGDGLSRWGSDHDDALPASGNSSRWMTNDSQPVASNSAGLYKLVTSDYNSPETFRCASAKLTCPPAAPKSKDFASACDIHYSYQHMLNGRTERLSGARKPKIILSDRTPLATWNQHFPNHQNDSSPNHQAGQNVLYTDGRVEWTTDADCGIGGDNIFSPKSYKGNIDGTETPEADDDTFLLPAWAPMAAK
ncbi:MAG: hypothetical protein HN909_04400 [Phycisphaerales bacterium]|jgi:hypothetical protein|nr:hypothetical protein [Phycisphaerales bacterium]MBT7170993.1 hypothetical protein [Phycisphaerales bacterium]